MTAFHKKIIKRLILGVAILTGSPALAQSAHLTDQDLLMLVVAGAVLVVAILVLIVAIMLVMVLKTILQKEGALKSEAQAVVQEAKPSLWERLNARLTKIVPVEKEETVMLDHDYDGIKELDNHLPPWWKWLFYFTIIVSVIYLFVYHVIDYFPLMDEEYAIEMKEANEKLATLEASGAVETIDVNNPVKSEDPAVIASGMSIFNTNCASCHAVDGGGGIGPNLTDNYWLHGGSFQDIFTVVNNGVDGTSMIAWKNVFSPVQVRDVSSYVATLVGTNPAASKDGEGELYVPQETDEADDQAEGEVVEEAEEADVEEVVLDK